MNAILPRAPPELKDLNLTVSTCHDSGVTRMSELKKPRESALQKKRRHNERINLLAEGARPAEVTEPARRRLFEEWDRMGRTIEQGELMVKQAKAERQKCVEEIVRKLGRTHYRYKDTLYSVSAKGDTLFLRPLGKHAIDV